MRIEQLLAKEAAIRLLGPDTEALEQFRKLVEVAYLSGFNDAKNMNYIKTLRKAEDEDDDI